MALNVGDNLKVAIEGDFISLHFTSLHPDDIAVAERLFDLHLQGHTPLFECEIRVRMKDGGWRWALVRGRTVERDNEGRPLRVAGTFMDITDRREADDRLRTSLREKEILVREIHHRVKHNLQVMTSLLRLQARYAKNQPHPDIFRECEDRLRSMSMVHERLHQSENLAFLRADDYLAGLFGHLQGSYGTTAGRVSVRTDIRPIALNVDTAIPIGFIVTKLFTNCLKHAFPDGRRGDIEITLREVDADMLELMVKDDGVGMGLTGSRRLPTRSACNWSRFFQPNSTLTFRWMVPTAVSLRSLSKSWERDQHPCRAPTDNGGRTHERIGYSQGEEDSRSG